MRPSIDLVRPVLIGAALTILLADCSSGSAAPAVEVRPRAARGQALAGGEAPGAITLRRVPGAPLLVALPATATYAFAAPSSVFGNISPAEDASPTDPELESLRESAAIVLRGNGWREVSKDSAQFQLSVAYTERPHIYYVTRPDPRGEVIPPRRCGVSSPAGCVEPLPPRYAPIVTPTPIIERRIGFAIVRTADNGRKWWMVDGTDRAAVEQFLSREVVKLLLVETP